MKPLFRKIVHASIAAGLSLLAGATAVAQEDPVGIVRITKPKASTVMAQLVRLQISEASRAIGIDVPAAGLVPDRRRGPDRTPRRHYAETVVS